MESLVADLSDLQLEEKYRRYRVVLQTLVKVHYPEAECWLTKDVRNKSLKEESNKKHEIQSRISDAELENVHLRYVPDYIKKLRYRKYYWQYEYQLHKDLKSEMDFKKYLERETSQIIRHWTVIENLDKQLPSYNVLQSLDPERIQTLVDFMEDKLVSRALHQFSL